jgi:6-phosphogluconolactonase
LIDTKQSRSLTRRAFSNGMLSVAALSKTSWASSLLPVTGGQSGYAFVGTHEAIHVFDLGTGTWRQVQRVSAVEPAVLEIHPFLPVLYVIHNVGLWDHLPRGAVSTYSIHGGRLRFEQTQPLSLSATFPRRGKVSRDGRYLAVAAGHGGIYNLLPIKQDGSLQSATGIIKEFGRTHGLTHSSARPNAVAWHPDGTTLLSADIGNGHLSSFATDGQRLERVARIQVYAGIGASHISVSADGRHVYALDAEDGFILVQSFDPATKMFAHQAHVTSQSESGPAILATCADGNLMMTVGAGKGRSMLTAWRIDAPRGDLQQLDQIRLMEGQKAICTTSSGGNLFGVAAASGKITQWGFDEVAGRFSIPVQVAQVDGAISLAVLSIATGRS